MSNPKITEAARAKLRAAGERRKAEQLARAKARQAARDDAPRPVGRPAATDESLTERLSLKVRPSELADYRARAAETGLTLAQWIRSRLVVAATK